MIEGPLSNVGRSDIVHRRFNADPGIPHANRHAAGACVATEM